MPDQVQIQRSIIVLNYIIYERDSMSENHSTESDNKRKQW